MLLLFSDNLANLKVDANVELHMLCGFSFWAEVVRLLKEILII